MCVTMWSLPVVVGQRQCERRGLVLCCEQQHAGTPVGAPLLLSAAGGSTASAPLQELVNLVADREHR